MSQTPSNENFNDEFNAPTDLFAAAAAADERAGFITKTYMYLTGSILALIAIEVVLFNVFDPMVIMNAMFGNQISILVVFGLFIGASWIANSWALNATSSLMQHLGLGLYIAVQSLVLLPLLSLTFMLLGPQEGWQTIQSAGLATGGLFVLMTLAVFITRKDFSFLGPFLWFGGFAIIGLLFMAIAFNFALGPMVFYGLIAFACLYILYDTSNVLHHYRIGQHVAAALALFASVVMLFYWILRLFLASRD